jgi:hypothetical protein
MTLIEALKDIQTTRRSRTFIFAGKAHSLKEKLDWLRDTYGNKEIRELVEG